MKKIISIIICIVMVLAMGLTAFAATSNDPTQGGTPGTIPGNNAPDLDILWNNPSVIIDMTEDVNPNTGASAMGIAAIVMLSGAAAFFDKRK